MALLTELSRGAITPRIGRIGPICDVEDKGTNGDPVPAQLNFVFIGVPKGMGVLIENSEEPDGDWNCVGLGAALLPAGA